jgi:tetratricopeptide (TPR) repeat protein
MGANDHLEELLRRWQQSARQSPAITLEELCHDCPQLLPLLRDKIAALNPTLSATRNAPDQNAPTEAGAVPAEPTQSETLQIPGFQVEGELGRGGMGVVLLAREQSLGRPLAVKVLLSRYDDDPQMQQRFLEEAQVMGQLQHPGVPAVHQLGKLSDGRPFFSMKLVRGQTLAQLLRQRHSPAEELPRFLGIFGQVCETVAYAHSRGILHRDLKPSNIMVGAFGEVQVMDWGLAKQLRSADGEWRGVKAAQPDAARGLEDPARAPHSGLRAPQSTEAGTVVETPAYMAPEQARGEVAGLDERADVFGLGAILCEVLTGEPPFRGRPEAIYQQAARGELADALVRLQASGIDAEQLTLAKDCLAPQREQRPRDAGVVAARMTAYQLGVQERLRQAELAQAQAQVKAAEERKRRRVQRVLAAVVVVLLLGGGGAFWWLQQQRQAADAAAQQAMAKARLLLDQAKASSLLDVARFQEALSEAQKAEQLAQTGGASEEVNQQATQLAGRIGREKEAAQRDRRLLAELLEVRGPREGPKYRTDARGLMVELAEPSADQQFVSAFRTWGLDVDATPTAAASARLKDQPAAVVTEVIAALDEWAGERRQHNPAANWQHLANLAEALDRPDSRLRELRAIVARGKLPLERALAALSMALRPVPMPFDVGLGKDRARLRRLAEKADAAKEPVLGLLTLARALEAAGEQAQAERLLKAALRARPQEVVLYHSLGQMLERQTPPRWGAALECYAVARGLRPDLGDSLALALLKVGRADEGLALFERLAGARPNNPWLQFRRGYALHEVGRLKEAEAAYRAALRLKPDDAPAHYNLGNVLYVQGRVKEAEAALRQAIRFNNNFPEAHYNLGVILGDQGRPREAEAAYRLAIRTKPDFAQAHYNLGTALREQHRFTEAEAAYREAIRLQPDHPEANSNLGSVVYAQGRANEAEAAYRQALHFKPADPYVHYNLGVALSDQGRVKEAEAAYREALRLQPDHALAHNGLGGALHLQGRLKEAEAALRQALVLQPAFSKAHTNLGVVLKDQGRLKEAETEHREAIRLEPSEPQAHANLGNSLYGQHRYKEAEAAYRQAIQLKPDFPQAHNNLGNALRQQGRVKEAEAEHREAIRLRPNDPLAHTNLGVVLAAQSRFKEAEAACRDALRLKPDLLEAHYNLGNALSAQGRSQEAEAVWRAALRLKPDVAVAHYSLGNALFSQRRFSDAEAAYRAALRLQADHPQAHHNLGTALSAQGRFKEAEASFRAVIRLKADYTEAHYNLGTLLNARGRFKEGEEALRAALRLQPNYPEAHCNLGLALRHQGQFAASLQSYRQGHGLGSKRQGWRYPSDQWLRQAERLVELDAKLPAVLAGESKPASAAERLQFASVSRLKRLHAAATRLAAETFLAEPKLANDLNKQHRYHAACSAALAAAGQAEDAKKLTDKDRTALRQQALGWLRADLTLYAKLAEGDNPKVRQLVGQRLKHWQRDLDFASVREPAALGKLAEAERDAWRKLWVEAEALRQHAARPH